MAEDKEPTPATIRERKKTNWSGYSWTRVKMVADNAYR